MAQADAEIARANIAAGEEKQAFLEEAEVALGARSSARRSTASSSAARSTLARQ
jgi:hypothetical protein